MFAGYFPGRERLRVPYLPARRRHSRARAGYLCALNFRAPEGNTTYLEYQMLQEAYQYFGEKERVDLVVK